MPTFRYPAQAITNRSAHPITFEVSIAARFTSFVFQTNTIEGVFIRPVSHPFTTIYRLGLQWVSRCPGVLKGRHSFSKDLRHQTIV